jgi:3-dehydrosphinganine reductase
MMVRKTPSPRPTFSQSCNRRPLKEGVHALRGIGGYALSSHAIITGGSSGIGLATACLLASKGMSITIVARNIERLNWAKDRIESAARGRIRVWAISCDVGAREACRAAVAESISELGSPNWAISNAGIVTPGTFMAQSLDDHEAQLQTNYIGSLNFVHSVIPNMATHGGGHLVFVGSGAALVGLFGYSGYGPSKFAIRGLAEVLRIELRPHRIIVTLVHPPDTNTPQLAFEAKMRPGPTSEIARAAGVWEPEQIAKALFKGASKGRFLVTPGFQLTMLSVLSGIVGPAFRSYQDWVVSKYPK